MLGTTAGLSSSEWPPVLVSAHEDDGRRRLYLIGSDYDDSGVVELEAVVGNPVVGRLIEVAGLAQVVDVVDSQSAAISAATDLRSRRLSDTDVGG